jgi:CheY-like chemotaxis protein
MTVHRVMCVDDEPQVLSGLERSLRKLCPTVIAVGGEAALSVLRRERDFAVIISDMRMPGMDGARFLLQARLIAPDAVRILLTGEADLDAVIAAVNEGHIQHYLRKPVDREALHRLVERSFLQFEERVSEREGVSSSMRAASQLATELVRVKSPLVAEHADRSSRIAARIAAHLDLRALTSITVATQFWALCRNQPGLGRSPLLDAMFAPLAEFDSARQALAELSRGEPADSSSVVTKVVTAACLIDELDQGAYSAPEVLALLERLVDERVLSAARELDLLDLKRAA